jgi:hypothetical protein
VKYFDLSAPVLIENVCKMGDYSWSFRPLGRTTRRREDNIKMDQAVGCGAWTGLSWLRIGTGGGPL